MADEREEMEMLREQISGPNDWKPIENGTLYCPVDDRHIYPDMAALIDHVRLQHPDYDPLWYHTAGPEDVQPT